MMNHNGENSANDMAVEHKKKDVTRTSFCVKSSSAYNLFFQYSRIMKDTCEATDQLPPSSYGLEHIDIESSPILMMASDEKIMRYRKGVIKQTLQSNQRTTRQKNCKTRSNQMCFAEMSKHISTKWQKTDELTKRIFRELAKESSERRHLAEYEMFKAASARFHIKPVTDALEEPDSLSDLEPHANDFSTRDRTQLFNNVDSISEFQDSLIGNIPTGSLTSNTDWTPFPFHHRFDEIDILEFNDLLSHYDWD